MNKSKNIYITAVTLSMLLLLGSCSAMIEKPEYTILKKEGNFEIREYKPHIVAETVVDSDFNNAGNFAFRRLFNYIDGENKTKESISMTAPVNQEARSEKISMTAPVNQKKLEDKFAVSFVMPSKFNMETLPEPINPEVIIKEIPAQKTAVIRFSGTWGQNRYEEQRASLQKYIDRKKLTPIGKPIFARYNPPFTLWFLRRNEVIIPVK